MTTRSTDEWGEKEPPYAPVIDIKHVQNEYYSSDTTRNRSFMGCLVRNISLTGYHD